MKDGLAAAGSLKYVQDHDRDAMLQRIISKTGRQIPFESCEHQARDNDLDEETAEKRQMQNTCSSSACSTGTDAKMLTGQTQLDENTKALVPYEANITSSNQRMRKSPHFSCTGEKNMTNFTEQGDMTHQAKTEIPDPDLLVSSDDFAENGKPSNSVSPLDSVDSSSVVQDVKNAVANFTEQGDMTRQAKTKIPDPDLLVASDDFAENGKPSNSVSPLDSVDSSSIVQDVKDGVNRISEELNEDASHGSHVLPSTRRRLFFKQHRLESKDLLRFRLVDRFPQIQSVNMINEDNFCYPRFASEETRKTSLRNCTEPQLSGYEYQELARVGWYFNRRALVTFCCGMEMPMTPNGHPLDVHVGLSPQCEFAHSLLRPAPEAARQEIQTTERQQEDLQSLQASGGASDEIHFSIPVQATDNECGSSGVEAAAYAFDSYAFDTSSGTMQASYQESAPGNQWVTDGESFTAASPSQMLDASYYASIVTNRTPADAEQWQPFAGNQEEPSAQQGPAGVVQNPSHGRLLMRNSAHNPLGNARLLRDLESDNGRQSPPDYGPADQINMDGRHGDAYRARYPQFGFPSVRVWTFEGWLHTHAQTPSMMSDAGFFYAGKYIVFVHFQFHA